MHSENSIVMHAPIEKIFETAVDLSLWPKILPHYRWIRYIERSPKRNIVIMAAKRKWIPVRWTSEQKIDGVKMEVRFRHLTAFTKGMVVVWTFAQTENGVEVRICHDLTPSIPLVGRFVAESIIGKFFISYIANQTLVHMKKFIERRYES